MEQTRDQRIETAYQKLTSNLDDMTTSYRALLELVRKEKDFLLSADLEKLQENNQNKEAVLFKVKALDVARDRYAKELADQLGGDVTNPRLLELAQKLAGTHHGDSLRKMHATLELLVRRASEINQENESYAKSALSSLNGALDDIKDTLAGKSTYEKKGKKAYGPEKTGNFVRKQG